jgi:hypothetical protein
MEMGLPANNVIGILSEKTMGVCGMADSVKGQGVESDKDILHHNPTEQKIDSGSNVPPSGSVNATDDRALLRKALIWFFLLVLWAGLSYTFWAAMGTTKYPQHRTTCLNNLKDISTLCGMYKNTYGTYPDAESLYRRYKTELRDYSLTDNQLITRNFHYLFVGQDAKDLEDFLVVGNEGVHSDFMVVLYKDGHVILSKGTIIYDGPGAETEAKIWGTAWPLLEQADKISP